MCSRRAEPAFRADSSQEGARGHSGNAGGFGGPDGAPAACPLLPWNLTGGRERKSLRSCVQCHAPVDRGKQAPLSVGFSRQEYWSGGLPGGSVVKESACQCRGHGFNPRSEKIPPTSEPLKP